MTDEATNRWLKHSHVGIQLGLMIGLFAYAGHWLDERLGGGGLFLFLGMMVGFGLGLYQLTREVFGDQAKGRGRGGAGPDDR